MPSIHGTNDALMFLYGVGLSFPPPKERDGQRVDVAHSWSVVLGEDIDDTTLQWAAERWCSNGNTSFPKPMELRQLVTAERGQQASKRSEARDTGCDACNHTGARDATRHLLLMRWPEDGMASFHFKEEDAWLKVELTESDVRIIQGWFISGSRGDHLRAMAWAGRNKQIAGLKYVTYKVRCDCEAGLRFSTYQDLGPWLDAPDPMPLKEPAPRFGEMRAVACRQYITGTDRRYHPDDTEMTPEGGGGPVRFYSQPSPEERIGPRQGPHYRKIAAQGLSGGAAAFVSLANSRDKHKKRRAAGGGQ